MTPKKVYVIAANDPVRIKALHNPGDLFMVFLNGNKYLLLTLSGDRRLFDETGTEYACEDETLMKDLTDRTGVGILSFPQGHWTEAAARPHDFETSCTIYQLSNNRSDSEKEFRFRLDTVSNTRGRKILTPVVAFLSRAFSWNYWDVKKTRWK